MQIVVQVHSLNLPYFPFFHKFLSFFYIQTFFYTIMNLFITLLENVNKSRTSANNVSLMYSCLRNSTCFRLGITQTYVLLSQDLVTAVLFPGGGVLHINDKIKKKKWQKVW
jgi:hypothetical protein